MEVWNSFNGTVRTVIDVLPQEVGRGLSLDSHVMTSINDYTELVITGGWDNGFVSDIWKFTYASNNWQFKDCKEWSHCIFNLEHDNTMLAA